MEETGMRRYGDYPELFWDLSPDEPVDANDPVILARLLTQAKLDTIVELASPAVLRRELEHLVIPEYTRQFWRGVLVGSPETRAA